MCGIFGIVVNEEKSLGEILTDAGRRLSYRGYDSVGCATFHADGTVDLRKDVGKVGPVAERLNFAEMTGARGITQLRWATFGAPSPANAQPHFDSDGDLVGAHNGNVVNNEEDARLRANAHELIALPPSGPLLAPLLAVLPLQMLAYRVSVARGYDPDFPRNLSKTLTVD